MSLNNEFEDFSDVYSEPLLYYIDAESLTKANVNWWLVCSWLIMHPEIIVTPMYEKYCTVVEFPTRELKLEFFLTFPGVLKGEE
jgi:hypothetical protein